jgi:hypothetical protein
VPSLKRNVQGAPEETGFESYDGPELPMLNKMYRGRIEVARIREASTGTKGINLLVKFQAESGSPDAKYDGYAAWCDLWLGDKEPNQAREAAFYRAVGVPKSKLDAGDVIVKHDDIDDGGAITAVAGRKVIGQIVKVDMRTDRYENETRMKADSVWPAMKDGAKSSKSEPEEEPDDDAMEDVSEREAELLEMKLPALRSLAKEYEIKTRGVSQEDLVAAILEAEAEDEPDDDERRAELEAMSLPALRKIAKEEYEITTRGKSAEVLVDEILEAEAEAEPEGEAGEEDLYAVVSQYSLPNLRKWALENGEYKQADLKDLSKEEILDLLIEDEVLSEPPF